MKTKYQKFNGLINSDLGYGYMQFLDDHCKANFNKSFKETIEDQK